MRHMADDIIVEKLIVGPMAVNCYVVADAATKNACVIDPGLEPEKIKRSLRKHSLDLRFIINTHGHADHIGANGYFDAPVFIHRLEADFLQNPEKNLSGPLGFLLKPSRPARLLEDGEVLRLGGTEFEVIHTPGHTPGSISVRSSDIIFTGDALFAGGIGRTDFSYGDEGLLLASIRDRLLVLPDETIVHPGHGDSSTIGEERRNNPFLQI